MLTAKLNLVTLATSITIEDFLLTINRESLFGIEKTNWNSCHGSQLDGTFVHLQLIATPLLAQPHILMMRLTRRSKLAY
jgi:hypothetical protein